MTATPVMAVFEPSGVLAASAGERLSAGAALAAARSLAAAMPPSRHIVNVCESLDCFIVAALAALVEERTLLLPPSRLPRALAELLAQFPDAVCVADEPADADGTAGVREHVARALRAPVPGIDRWPVVRDDHVAAILFTSGSTGAPTAHAKTWSTLVEGARALMRSIDRPAPRIAIVGTVPPQHMFGLETTVVLPLQSGTTLCVARPAFAADLVDAISDARSFAPDGVWLMTTPLQLRAFHREQPALQGVAGVIASTMPLDPELAARVERDWGTAVHEVYGCTEGGMLAVRRATVGRAWTPAHDVRFAIGADGAASAIGGHVRNRIALADRLRPVGDNGGFELVGRHSDFVKVAGKRGSLAGLTRELTSIAGVVDGAFFLARDDASRVAAVAVAPGTTAAALRAELARRIDAAFLPRPLLLVDALPRADSGKLPLAALRALAASKGRRANAEWATLALERETFVAPEHPALRGHFPARPIVPGVVLLAFVEDLLRDARLRIVECMQVKWRAPVSPGERLRIRVDVERRRTARFEIFAGATSAASGRLRCADVEDVR